MHCKYSYVFVNTAMLQYKLCKEMIVMAAPATVIMIYWFLEPPPTPTAIIIIIPGVAIVYGVYYVVPNCRDGEYPYYGTARWYNNHSAFCVRLVLVPNSSFDQ